MYKEVELMEQRQDILNVPRNPINWGLVPVCLCQVSLSSVVLDIP